MKKMHKLVMAGTMIAAVSLTVVGYTAAAAKGTASVVRGQYDFSDMTVRRVWFNTGYGWIPAVTYWRKAITKKPEAMDPLWLPWRKCFGSSVLITGKTAAK